MGELGRDSVRNWSRSVYVALGQSSLQNECLSPRGRKVLTRLQRQLRSIECPDPDAAVWHIQGFQMLVAGLAYADAIVSQSPELEADVFAAWEPLCWGCLPGTFGETADLNCRQAAAVLRIGKLATESVQLRLEAPSLMGVDTGNRRAWSRGKSTTN